ncbi:MAG: hypothetical protein ACFHWX_00855 [Bacteroidota bacterium]
MKRFMIIGVLLVLGDLATAQNDFLNGYVVLNTGDTLYGLVKDRKDGINPKLLDRIIFKGDRGRQKFRPDQLLAYHRGGSNFHSVPFSVGTDLLGISRIKIGPRHFLKVYIHDYMSLYMDEYVDDSGPSYDGNFYLIREDELQFVQASILFFRKRMVPYFEDAPHIAKAIEDKDYKYRDIITIITEYNNWIRSGSR